ncbi:RNA-binding protein 1 [Galendromus occidentalis]|uniref:RNA-binding protein 1 n=1 Tax=Galendromus occidentalis TaxID=34638 RepID=A0AAJ6QQ08_9ACAR|nr:RNA-binding protein 1 [Galendromus occidentalis]
MSNRDWELTCKVYIGNLANHTSRHDIESAFGKYGNLRNVWVARNPPGFAFVEFEDSRDAEDAVRALDGSRICGSRVKCEMSHGKRRNGGFRGGRGGRRDRSRSFDRRRSFSRSRSRSRSRSYGKDRAEPRGGGIPRGGARERSFSRSPSRERSRSRNRNRAS